MKKILIHGNINSYMKIYNENKCEIYFYEWSDINRMPLKFKTYTKLYKFLNQSQIIPTKQDNDKIKQMKRCFITCKQGTKELIIANEYKKLHN